MSGATRGFFLSRMFKSAQKMVECFSCVILLVTSSGICLKTPLPSPIYRNAAFSIANLVDSTILVKADQKSALLASFKPVEMPSNVPNIDDHQ